MTKAHAPWCNNLLTYVDTCTYFSILGIVKLPLEGSKQKENNPAVFFVDADTPVQLRLNVCVLSLSWSARYNTWLLIKLMPTGAVFPFLLCLTASCVLTPACM